MVKLYYNENIARKKNPEIAGNKVKKRTERTFSPYCLTIRLKKIFALQD